MRLAVWETCTVLGLMCLYHCLRRGRFDVWMAIAVAASAAVSSAMEFQQVGQRHDVSQRSLTCRPGHSKS